MRILVAAVGRLKGPESELCGRYLKRAVQAGRALGWREVDVIEVKESRAEDAGRRRIEESIALVNLLPAGSATVLLDPRGDNLDSTEFANCLAAWRHDNRAATAFIIGGPDGLADSLLDKADLRLAFGTATWPHQLVRAMLLEQLYRAGTILSGHPYHRG